MDNGFLKQIQLYLSLTKNGPEDGTLIHSIAEYLFSRQALLEEDENTLALINLLGDGLSGKSISHADIHTALYPFWLSCIGKAKIDLFYLGELANLKTFATSLNPATIRQIHYLASNETDAGCITDFFSKIDRCVAPFVIYDPDGLSFSEQAQNEALLGKISLYDLLTHNLIPSTDKINEYSLLWSRQYQQLADPKVKSVIIGNSYGLYGFPDSELRNSVNLSMHSLGLKLSKRLVEHILLNYPHIDHFVFCIGFFELYGDLFKSKHPFNRNIIDAFSQLIAHYGIAGNASEGESELTTFSRLGIEKPASARTRIADIDNPEFMESVYQQTQQLIASTPSLAKEQQDLLAAQRAGLHSHAVSHQLSLSENKRRVEEMVAELTKAGKTAVWVMPPQPAAYVENIAEEMYQTHVQFFAGLTTLSSRFIDLSQDGHCLTEDFRDGDHLNFTGACKLVNRLRELDVIL